MRCHWPFRFLIVGLLNAACVVPLAHGSSCVWKVTAPNGATLYLGGSIHALRSTDYPLPPAFNWAFDSSTRLAFEVDRKAIVDASKGLVKAGQYRSGDNLKKHVDPRTYDYLRRLFALMKVPEQDFVKLRPWFIALLLQTSSMHGLSSDLGVEEFLAKRAEANHKPVSGLESTREHMEVFSGLSDRQSEAMLLLTFIPADEGSGKDDKVMQAWRRGDADLQTRSFLEAFRDYPSLADRILTARNRKWIPKIEGYLRSGQTYFVVAGAAHMGGAQGVLALLKARGYRIEQL